MFPVEQGKPTPLSKVTNEDFSRAMLKDGERDLEIGRQLTRAAFYDKAVYHFQQATEKACPIAQQFLAYWFGKSP